MISGDGLDILFRNARTYGYWLDKSVSDDLLREIYDVMKFAPTSANSNPDRKSVV
jgi:3-hydroxypropanoate dehydrogenase